LPDNSDQQINPKRSEAAATKKTLGPEEGESSGLDNPGPMYASYQIYVR
jgi:hypothetical protein